MAKLFMFLAIITFGFIKCCKQVQRDPNRPENMNSHPGFRCWRLLKTNKCSTRVQLRGGEGDSVPDNIAEMPTFTPAPRLVGTKDCPPEEIISTFRAPAIKKDILVNTARL